VTKERIQVATARLNKVQRTIDALAKYAQRKTQAEGRSLVRVISIFGRISHASIVRF